MHLWFVYLTWCGQTVDPSIKFWVIYRKSVIVPEEILTLLMLRQIINLFSKSEGSLMMEKTYCLENCLTKSCSKQWKFVDRVKSDIYDTLEGYKNVRKAVQRSKNLKYGHLRPLGELLIKVDFKILKKDI